MPEDPESSRLNPEMMVLEVLYNWRQTEAVFAAYEARAGVCLLCQDLFTPLNELSRKYGLDLSCLLAELRQAIDSLPAEKP